GDRLHVLLDRGFLTTLDASTGKALLDKAGLGRSLQFTASPVMAGDRLVAVTEDAEVLVLDPATPGKPLARHALGGMALATPAVSGGALFVRTQNELVQLKSR
ncbi:MAG: PQQ-binding-like beta-propeller repeat protein, partial [Planctomycetota bacterium]